MSTEPRRRLSRSEVALARELRLDALREEANRKRCPRGVAIEALLTVAIEHERAEGWSDRMPMPAFEQLEAMHGEVSDAIRSGRECSEEAQRQVVAFIHEHVKRPEVLMAKVAAAVGA